MSTFFFSAELACTVKAEIETRLEGLVEYWGRETGEMDKDEQRVAEKEDSERRWRGKGQAEEEEELGDGWEKKRREEGEERAAIAIFPSLKSLVIDSMVWEVWWEPAILDNLIFKDNESEMGSFWITRLLGIHKVKTLDYCWKSQKVY